MDRKVAGLKSRTRIVTVFLLYIGFGMAAGAAHGQEGCRLTVLGDSLTAGYGVPEGQSFPDQLSRALDREGIDCDVINAGVSGDTSAGGLARLDWVLSDKPTHLLVELGANDGLRALATDQLEVNLDSIIVRAKAAGVSVMLAGMLAPPNLGRAYGDDFARVFRDVADRHEVPLYPFFLDGVAAQPDYLIEDALHPNADGIARITDLILPEIIHWIRPEIE
ncbi:MAG: arylesterase [Geminicoccaceae bacterium]